MALVKAIDFYGKHADIVNLLTNETSSAGSKSIIVFERKLDVWYVAGFLGLKHNRFIGEADKSTKTKTSVFVETLNNNIDEINLYTTLLALKLADIDDKKQLQAALLNEIELDNQKLNYEQDRMDLFHGYALGGLEYIEQKLLPVGLETVTEVDFQLITSQFVNEIQGIGNEESDDSNIYDDLF